MAQCTAHLSDGSGTRCKKHAINGGTVCATHGGSAPQVKDAARKKLQEAAEDAVSKLVNLMEAEDERVQLDAATRILDRAGYTVVRKTELSGGDTPVRFTLDITPPREGELGEE